MNEGLRNLTVLLWALCAVNNNSYASDAKMVIAEESAQNEPTIIYGSARKSADEVDDVIVEQGAGAANPLGNPIVLNNVSASVATETKAKASKPLIKEGPQGVPVVGNGVGPIANGSGPQGEPVVQNGVAQLGNQFQNTVEEANGMVYDTQAYPIEDLDAMKNSSNPKTIYSPNVNN